MNTKLSGAQSVLVPITQVGRNHLPFVENLNGRWIKYIDFAPAAYLPDTTAAGLQTSAGSFMTIFNKWGNTEIIRELPLERFDYSSTLGVRQPICSEIALADSYINCQDPALVGKTALLVFWYDLPEYSARNTKDNVVTDSVSIPLTTGVRYNQFPDVNRMVGKRFRRILLGAPDVTPNMETGIGVQELANIYVTLRKGSYNVLDQVPVSLLRQLTMLQASEFQNIIFDFQSSFLTIGGQGTIPTLSTDYLGRSVFFNLQYEA